MARTAAGRAGSGTDDVPADASAPGSVDGSADGTDGAAGAAGAAPWAPIVDAIGPKVRDLRQQAGLSLQQLARRADVSAAAIHKVERGDMVPTVTTLLKLATALGRPVTHFVHDGTPEPVASFVAADARPVLPSPVAEVVREGISGPPERFRVRGAVTEVSPGGTGGGDTPRGGEELVHVLAGRLDFEIAGEQHAVRAGDSLHYPADRLVRWHNPSPETARAIWLSTRGS